MTSASIFCYISPVIHDAWVCQNARRVARKSAESKCEVHRGLRRETVWFMPGAGLVRKALWNIYKIVAICRIVIAARSALSGMRPA
jgi:hypothetical protein